MEKFLYKVMYITDHDIDKFATTVYEPDGNSVEICPTSAPECESFFLGHVPPGRFSPIFTHLLGFDLSQEGSGRVNPECDEIQSLSRQLFDVSLKLENVPAAFMADAVWFFNSGIGLADPLYASAQGNWTHLKKLALTTFLLRPKNTRV